MNIHNLMEEVVINRVNDLYEQVKQVNATWLTCDCENCRLDAISYVLNRIPPKYVVSGRGALHTNDELESPQIKADIDSIGMEGIRIVSTTKRPFHIESRENKANSNKKSPCFNFPMIQGTVLDGSTFEPLTDVTIYLKQDGKIVEMADATWHNPTQTYHSTNGTYSFWPKAVIAEKEDEIKKFSFTVEVSCSGYESVTCSFDVSIVAEAVERIKLDSSFSMKIKNLVMFKSEIQNEMDRAII
ncbi:late competence development ComFB family protein [Treponema pectinovorum]|uniref:late competence development ComFB family protein n=1 Tax=Treponema pectinovorum TaxID=164 RepID=UPI0011F0D384|nr:late competence development ComFB family protein [Treponema pectinovorum]